MNLRKNLGRVASTIVATALLASVATVPAFAADAEVNFVKTIDMTNAQGASVPDVTYSYTVASGTAVTGDPDRNIPDIKAGNANDLTIANVDFGPTDTVTNNKVTKEAEVTFAENAYTAPGIYRYTVTEQDPTDPDITYDTDTYTLDVYVINSNGTLEVANAIWMRGTPVTPTLDENGNAVYGEDEDAAKANKIAGDEDQYKTYSLTVTKEVEGTMADAGREYDFQIDLSGLDNGAKVTNGENAVTDTDNDGSISVSGIKLVPNDESKKSVTITGIPSDALYTIVESLDESEGYTVTIKNGSELTCTDDKYSTTEATQGKQNQSVTIVNKRDAVSPTGIAMNVAPYALLVVVAVAGCFVFLRKRNED